MDHETKRKNNLELRKSAYLRAVKMMSAEGFDATMVDEWREGDHPSCELVPAIMSCSPAVLVGHYITRAAAEIYEKVVPLDGDSLVMTRLLIPLRSQTIAISTVYY